MLKEKGSKCKDCKHYKKGRTRKPCAECREIFNSNYEFDMAKMIFKEESSCNFTVKITPNKQDKSKALFSVIMPDGKKALSFSSQEVTNSSMCGLISSWAICQFVETLIYGLLIESQTEVHQDD